MIFTAHRRRAGPADPRHPGRRARHPDHRPWRAAASCAAIISPFVARGDSRDGGAVHQALPGAGAADRGHRRRDRPLDAAARPEGLHAPTSPPSWRSPTTAGASGRLRQQLGIVPPGDIRNCIAALADAEPLMTQLMQYRFPPGSGLDDHAFGNLFIAAMTGGDRRLRGGGARVEPGAGRARPGAAGDAACRSTSARSWSPGGCCTARSRSADAEEPIEPRHHRARRRARQPARRSSASWRPTWSSSVPAACTRACCRTC